MREARNTQLFTGARPSRSLRPASRRPCFRRDAENCGRDARAPLKECAFSLIEIMLAVALMTIIMLGLLAMFYQTQRAMRLGTAQVDAMGTGDAAMQLLMRELKEIASGGALSPSLQTRTPYPLLAWPRDFATQPQLTLLQEVFFIRRHNDLWIGTGYFVDPVTDQGGAGTLYRFEESRPIWEQDAVFKLYDAFSKADRNSAPRLADRVAHFQVRAFNADGTNIFGNGATNPSLNVIEFTNTFLPAYLDVELAVVEPKAFDRFRARYDTNNPSTAPFALSYLTQQVSRLHLFRQRIPIRTVQ